MYMKVMDDKALTEEERKFTVEETSAMLGRVDKYSIFVDAYIANRFNASEACREIMVLDNPNNYGYIGSQLLKHPKTQTLLRERLKREDVSLEWLVSQLKKHAEGGASGVALGALDRIGHIMGVETKATQKSSSPSSAVQINFNVPALESHSVIEATELQRDS
jgi:hypothetical protein